MNTNRGFASIVFTGVFFIIFAVGVGAYGLISKRNIEEPVFERTGAIGASQLSQDSYAKILKDIQRIREEITRLLRLRSQKQLKSVPAKKQQGGDENARLGTLCKGEAGCNEFCKNNLGRCREYCKANPQNSLCQKPFSFEQPPSEEAVLEKQFLALEEEVRSAKTRNVTFAPSHAERIEKDLYRLENEGYSKDKIDVLRKIVEEFTPFRKDAIRKTEEQAKQKEIQDAPSKEKLSIGEVSPPREEFRIAEPQQWVFDSITQPVPTGASQTRLASLPAPYEKILLQHLGAFGAHKGGHPEGLDHEWIDIQDGTPVASWADGKVIGVRLNNPSNPNGEWRIVIDYGGGLWGEHMDVKTPLVKIGDIVKTGQPVAWGVPTPWISGYHSGEFNLTDEHRRDGVKSWVRSSGVFVSPYDYLRDDIKQEFVDVFAKRVLETYVAKGDMTAGVNPWEPYLTNPLLFHKMYKGTLAGEWVLKSRKWAVDEMPDLIIFFADNTKYYDKQRVLANEDESESPVFFGTWQANYEKKQFIMTTEERGIFYGLFELDESGPRATLKIEYQQGTYPENFSEKAHVYIERDSVGRRQDGYNIGVRDSP